MKHTVGVADLKVTAGRGDSLITHALGSCLGLTIWDPVALVGGMLHVMLPLSTIDPAKAVDNPAMFVDTGVPKLFLEAYRLGAQKGRLVVKVAGGACPNCAGGDEADDYFQIGKRNAVMLKKLLRKNGVPLKAADLGGTHSRTLSLDVASGEVLVRANGQATPL